MDEVDRIMAGTSSADGVERLVTRYPIRDIAAEIVSEERILLGQRTAVADKARKRAELLRWGAMLAQLALLGTVMFFAIRQLAARVARSEEHTSELQSLMRISYAVFCLKKKTKHINNYEEITR